jgi:predicted nuclease of restriction endonuclease-like (RecB) superfamily
MEKDKHNKLSLAEVKSAVKVLKTAILQSQSRAIRKTNQELLALYYGIGHYISDNSRKGFWGTGAIEAISTQLKQEMPGLRGFSAANLKTMRIFYEEWSLVLNRQPAADDLPAATEIISIDTLILNRQPTADDLTADEFTALGFSLHMEILFKAKSWDERKYYIRQAAANRWDKYTLRKHLQDDDFHHVGQLPNNFSTAIPDRRRALQTLQSFKDEYLLDFINVEEIEAQTGEDVDEKVIENAIVAHIKEFILTFGRDFVFIAQQYVVEAAGHEQKIDLLFFNRSLNALVAVELKYGAFKPIYLGQLQLYLQALDDKVRKPHENPSVGIVLCKSADRAFVEYAVRDYRKPMGVAVYHTADEMPEPLKNVLPDIDALRQELENSGSKDS